MARSGLSAIRTCSPQRLTNLDPKINKPQIRERGDLSLAPLTQNSLWLAMIHIGPQLPRSRSHGSADCAPPPDARSRLAVSLLVHVPDADWRGAVTNGHAPNATPLPVIIAFARSRQSAAAATSKSAARMCGEGERSNRSRPRPQSSRFERSVVEARPAPPFLNHVVVQRHPQPFRVVVAAKSDRRNRGMQHLVAAVGFVNVGAVADIVAHDAAEPGVRARARIALSAAAAANRAVLASAVVDGEQPPRARRRRNAEVGLAIFAFFLATDEKRVQLRRERDVLALGVVAHGRADIAQVFLLVLKLENGDAIDERSEGRRNRRNRIFLRFRRRRSRRRRERQGNGDSRRE